MSWFREGLFASGDKKVGMMSVMECFLFTFPWGEKSLGKKSKNPLGIFIRSWFMKRKTVEHTLCGGDDDFEDAHAAY